jgi:hypothetical protein
MQKAEEYLRNLEKEMEGKIISMARWHQGGRRTGIFLQSN